MAKYLKWDVLMSLTLLYIMLPMSSTCFVRNCPTGGKRSQLAVSPHVSLRCFKVTGGSKEGGGSGGMPPQTSDEFFYKKQNLGQIGRLVSVG